MSNRRRDALNSSVVMPKNVIELLAGLGDIDERPYDFVGRLDVPGAELIGALSTPARRLHAASVMAQQQVAEARRAYESAKAYCDVVEGLFFQAVSEQFPAVVTVEQNPGGTTTKIQNGLFFGEGWAVFRADPDLLKQAKHDLRRQRREDRGSSEDMPGRPDGLLGALLEGFRMG